LISLAAGAVACWALYVLCSRLLLSATPAALLAGASVGSEGFFLAVVPAAACALVVSLVLGKIPLFRQFWMALGAIVIAAALCLFALVYLGTGGL